MVNLLKGLRLLKEYTLRKPPQPSKPDPSDLDGYDDSHEVSAMMGHRGGMAIRQNRDDPFR